MIKVNNLYYSYGKNNVLQDVSFEIKEGEFKFLLGENGTGKSTLIKCILGLLKYNRGKITFNGEGIEYRGAKFRSKIFSYVPQTHSPTFNYKVSDIILMAGVSNYNFFQSPTKKDYHRVEEILDRLHIYNLIENGYAEISGGQRQLVLIARAIFQNSKVIIMDEPTSGLDYGNHINIMNTLAELKSNGTTIFLSSHIPQDALDFADSVLQLKNGKVMNDGSVEKVVTDKSLSELYEVDLEIVTIDNKKVCIRKD